MTFRTRLGLTCLESRAVPDGTPGAPPQFDPPIYDPGIGGGIDPESGPIGGGDTNGAPTPPGGGPLP
jgi:hypothetical protein